MTYVFGPIRALAWRELARFYRQRSRIVGTLGTPLLFWVFLGSGLGAALPAPTTPGGMGYLEFFYPGVLLLAVLFTAIFSNISLIEDRHEGFLQGVLVAPVTPGALVGGKVLGGAAIAVVQGGLFLCLAPLAGFHPDLAGVGMALLALISMSIGLTALGFVFAWKLDSVQGFHGIMNLVLMPMWLLSGAFFPLDSAPKYLKPIMYVNPLCYGLEALKSALYGIPGYVAMPFWISFGVCTVSALGFWGLAWLLVARRGKKS